MSADSRIVVTGIGLVTPLGNGAEENWSRLRAGESGIGSLTKLEASGAPIQSAAQVSPYKLTGLRAPKNEKFMSPGVVHLMQSTLQAMASAKVDVAATPGNRIAVYAGAGQVGPEPCEFFRAFGIARTPDGEADFEQLGGHASRLVDPYFPLRTLSNAGIALVTIEIGARGPSNNFVQGEASGVFALNAACRDLRSGRADLALANGTDFLLAPTSFLNYAQRGLLSVLPPESALRPFDVEADGTVLGEGAVTFVLERYEDALKRGATPLAEICGIGFAMDTSDAPEPFHSAAPVAASLAAAGFGEPPDFVIANGFGFPAFDCREAGILTETLPGTPVTALKGQTGYLGAATALVEIALGIGMLRDRAAYPIQHHRMAPSGVTCRLVAGDPVALDSPTPAAACLTQSWSGQCAAVRFRAA